MTFEYLGASIASNGNLKEDEHERPEAAVMSGYLRYL